MSRSRVRVFQAIVLSFSTAAGLFAAELFLALSQPNSINQQRIDVANRIGVEFDARAKYQFIEDLRTSDETAITHFPPGISVTEFLRSGDSGSLPLLPLAGVSNSTTVTGNENGFFKTFSSDRFGFNNPNDAYERPVDVVMLGDSFTMGNNVRSPDEIAGQLRSQGLNVVNLGYGATGPLAQLAALTEYAAKFRPKLVLWFFFEGNDFFNLRREQQHPVLMRYVHNETFRQDLVARQSEIDRTLKAKVESAAIAEREKVNTATRRFVVDRIQLTSLRALCRRTTSAKPNDYDARDSDLELFERILQQANKAVASWGGEIQFAYLPDYSRFHDPTDKVHLDRRRERVREIAKKQRIETIDIAEAFEEHSHPLRLFPFELPGHYNADGYRLVGNAVKGAVLEKIGSRLSRTEDSRTKY